MLIIDMYVQSVDLSITKDSNLKSVGFLALVRWSIVIYSILVNITRGMLKMFEPSRIRE